MIKLVPIKEIQASEYNPRRNDEKRLALTELSLKKLGFLLPVYADTSGEILSGHQRCLVMFWRCLNFCGWIAIK